MANGLMNFVSQPSAASPLVTPTPAGIGGLGMAGPAGRGGYGGPTTRAGSSPGSLISSLATGLMLTTPTGYSRTKPTMFGPTIRGLGLGMQLHQQQMASQRAEAMQWAKIQNQIAESQMRRRQLEFELSEANRSRTQKAQQTAARRAMLQQDETLTPEAVESMSAGGADFEAWVKTKFAKPTAPAQGPEMWGPVEQKQFGDKTLAVQTSNRGQMRVVDKFTPEIPIEDQPMDTNAVRRMIDSEGRNPEVGTTPKEAQAQGFRPASQGEQTRMTALRGAKRILDQLKDMMLSEEEFTDEEKKKRQWVYMGKVPEYRGLAYENEPGVTSRALDYVQNWTAEFAQVDPRFAAYSSYAGGTVVPIVRALGEVGNLSQTEIQRGVNLIPTLHDTPDVARDKLKNLEQTLSSWADTVRVVVDADPEAEAGDIEALKRLLQGAAE